MHLCLHLRAVPSLLCSPEAFGLIQACLRLLGSRLRAPAAEGVLAVCRAGLQRPEWQSRRAALDTLQQLLACCQGADAGSEVGGVLGVARPALVAALKGSAQRDRVPQVRHAAARLLQVGRLCRRPRSERTACQRLVSWQARCLTCPMFFPAVACAQALDAEDMAPPGRQPSLRPAAEPDWGAAEPSKAQACPSDAESEDLPVESALEAAVARTAGGTAQAGQCTPLLCCQHEEVGSTVHCTACRSSAAGGALCGAHSAWAVSTAALTTGTACFAAVHTQGQAAPSGSGGGERCRWRRPFQGVRPAWQRWGTAGAG